MFFIKSKIPDFFNNCIKAADNVGSILVGGHSLTGGLKGYFIVKSFSTSGHFAMLRLYLYCRKRTFSPAFSLLTAVFLVNQSYVPEETFINLYSSKPLNYKNSKLYNIKRTIKVKSKNLVSSGKTAGFGYQDTWQKNILYVFM
jgi:hypothetical protein